MYVYAYSGDIHTVATNVLLTQQLFTVVFFVIKFKTLGLTIEPGLATKLCAKACVVNSGTFFKMSFCQKVIKPGSSRKVISFQA